MAKKKMIKQIKYKKNFKAGGFNMRLELDLSRFEKQYEEAQFKLDDFIMESMVPFMPRATGNFMGVTRAQSAALAGTGTVIAAAAPMGRFLYEGKGMIDGQTGSPWAKPGAKKVLVSQYSGKTNAKENLTYSDPFAVSHWFDAAKAQDGAKWVEKTKKIAGGGSK